MKLLKLFLLSIMIPTSLNASLLSNDTSMAMDGLFGNIQNKTEIMKKEEKDIHSVEIINTFNAYNYFLLKKNKAESIEYETKECKDIDEKFSKCHLSKLNMTFKDNHFNQFVSLLKIDNAELLFDKRINKVINLKLNNLIGFVKEDESLFPKFKIKNVTIEDSFNFGKILSMIFKPKSEDFNNLNFNLIVKEFKFLGEYLKIKKEKGKVLRKTQKLYLPSLFPGKEVDGIKVNKFVDVFVKEFDNSFSFEISLTYNKLDLEKNKIRISYNRDGRNIVSFTDFNNLFAGDGENKFFSPSLNNIIIIADQSHLLKKLNNIFQTNKDLQKEFYKLNSLRIKKNSTLESKNYKKGSFSEELSKAVINSISPFVYLEKDNVYVDLKFDTPIHFQTLFSTLLNEIYFKKATLDTLKGIKIEWK